MNTLEGQQQWCKRSRKLLKITEVVQPRDEDERGARSEKNDRCGHTREKENMAAKLNVESCV